ncbi:hypothetical protein [Kitasatospora sp. A2-31]|uniref:hypothetical protein n=1 Tax=Kitasatospora sp. A2-31 TaxID=2916414 RepID=UPI001EEF52BE|nr:hypothetical protein [Kitasatospora sp. A2-31]MCG6498891.1 hypothetical protein [Kitasatospora sp. A2-31]MCG6499482.1 hypothetical protein [Kitasatospora sp. A2-31]MCG6500204.1 hypothetical protein [Kitasatospora sp. A2-31]
MIDYLFDRIALPQPGGTDREHTLYTLAIPDLIEPEQHERLGDAIASLAAVLQAAPIRPDRANAYLWMIAGEGGEQRVLDYMGAESAFELRFYADGRHYTATITRRR